MARYIDADAVIKKAYPFPCAIGVEYAVSIREIDDAPTADVAPRSEVAREIFAEIEKEIESALERIHFADPLKIPSGLPREKHLACREGKTKALYGMERFINELKQKYTEDQK